MNISHERPSDEKVGSDAFTAMEQGLRSLTPAFFWDVHVTDVEVQKLTRGVVIIWRFRKEKGDPWPGEIKMPMPTARAELLHALLGKTLKEVFSKHKPYSGKGPKR